MAGVADIDRAETGKRLGGAAGTGRHHAVEHVDPAQNGTDDIVRPADAHQVAGLVVGQHSRRIIQHFKHFFLPFADRQSADGITVKADFFQPFRRPGAQIPIISPLLDAENAVSLAVNPGVFASFGPAHGHFDRFFHRFVSGRQLDAFVQTHGDVGIELMLDFHRLFGRQEIFFAVNVRTELHPFFAQFAQAGQAHDLKTAGIGQNRLRPVHKLVQAAHFFHQIGARTEHQMISVAEQYLRAGCRHRLRHHRLDRGAGADRHEGGGVDNSVFGMKTSAAGFAGTAENFKFQAHLFIFPL